MISNGVLALLRHPDALEGLRREPGLVVTLVEEVLRYHPPVQFRTRGATLAGVEVAGATIPEGATVALPARLRQPRPGRFPDAGRSAPLTARHNQHLGFGGGIHYCVGSRSSPGFRRPHRSGRARLLLFARPGGGRSAAPTRRNAALRGPEHLLVRFEHLADRTGFRYARRAAQPAASFKSGPPGVTILQKDRQSRISG